MRFPRIDLARALHQVPAMNAPGFVAKPSPSPATLPESVTHPALEAFNRNGIRHGFFTRRGGVSNGLYGDLNTGTGSRDDPASVAENRARIARSLGVEPARLVTVYQVHSPDVVTVTAPFAGERPKADAMVTAMPGIALGVLTADCGPVLFADAEAGVIGAAHAGWRGAVGGVLENTVAAMEALGAARGRIAAVLGPTIARASYEVGADFRDTVAALSPSNDGFFSPSVRDGHFMFDLPAYIAGRLRLAGVDAADTALCTYGDEERFFSFRRTTHRGEPDYGRQMSAIVMEAR